MALPTTEVTIFETSDAFRANPEAPLPAFEQARSKGVSIPIWYGPQAEDPSVGFVFANWESFEAHKAIMDAPFYRELLSGLAPALRGPFKLDHVIFSAPTAAFDYPITELTILNLKTPENRGALVELLSEIAAVTENLFVFGATRNDENRYFALCGWESVQAHKEARASPQSQDTLKKLYSLADEEQMYHVKLRKF